MQRQLEQILSPVRSRQRWQTALSSALYGCYGTGAAALLLTVAKWSTGALPHPGVVASLLAVGPILGALIGIRRTAHWRRAAAAVDVHYSLKDRTITALQLLSQPAANPLHELQVEETLGRLQSVDASHVAPITWPKWSRWAIGSAVAALAILVWPFASQPVEAVVDRPDGIAEAAAIIAEELEQLKDIAEDESQTELATAVEELSDELELLENPETDVREALATISEMQAEMAEMMQKYDTAAIDAQMQALAEALSSAAAFQGAAAELKDGDYAEAADELEKLEKADLDRKESRSLAERLAEVSAAMKQSGLSELSDTVDQLSDGCRDCDSDKLSKSSKSLAGQCRSQALRKNLAQLLSQKLNRLSECKSMCQGGQCKKCGGNCQSGQCHGKNSLARGESAKSEKASKNWGQGSHGKLDGESTSLDSQRTQEQVTGTAGDGPSEFETTSSPEGEENARRGYRDTYGKYRKLSETVLESEPIPLGQRQLIRNYFEIIRPDRDSEVLTETEAK